MDKTATEQQQGMQYPLRQAHEMQIVFSSEHPELLGRKLASDALKVSPGDLRIQLNQRLKLDSVLDVWVTLKDTDKKYFLTGNVRWINDGENANTYETGIVLRERSDTDTDLSSWQLVFES